MSILSGLFGKPERKSGSVVVQWAEKRRIELSRNNRNMTVDEMFAAFINGISSFADGQLPDNDAALFELGCYLYVRVDLWLFVNRRSVRNRVSRGFLRGFIGLFARALQMSDVDELGSLAEERIDGYGALERSGADTSERHYHLVLLIRQARESQQPQHCDFDMDGFIPGLPWEMAPGNSVLAAKLLLWEERVLPAVVDFVRGGIDMMQLQKGRIE